MIGPDDESETHSITIVFHGSTCDDCGEQTHVSIACGCGAWQPQPDDYIERRRPFVTDARLLLHAEDSAAQPIEPGEAVGILASWIAELFEGLGPLGSSEPHATLSRGPLERIALLRSRAAAVGRRRPWLALWDPLRALIDEFIRTADAYLDALEAGSPDDAQRFQQVGQAHLDEATRQINLVAARLAWWGIEHSIRTPGSIVAAAGAAYDATGAQSIIDLDARGMALYQRITGKPTGPTGAGIGLLIDLGLVDRAFDEERVYRIARLVYERLDRGRPEFMALATDDVRCDDLAHARRVFYGSQLTAETLLRGLAGERRMEVGAVLQLGAQMAERVSSTLLNIVVSSGAAKPLKPTEDYAKVLAAARDAGLGDALLGFDERIRNAHAHVDFDVADDHVVLGRHRSKPERVSDEDLVDIVLASVESCAAVFAAVDCALLDGGIAADSTLFEDMTAEERLEILLAVAGADPKRIELKPTRAEISATAHGDLELNPMSVAAIIGGHIPEEITRLLLRLKRPSGAVIANVDLDSLRRYQSSEGLAKEAGFVELMGRSRLNGQPILSRRHTRFLMATFVARLSEAPTDEVQAAVPALEAAARRLADPDLVAAMEALAAMTRARAGGPPPPLAAKAAYLKLTTFLATPPGPWNDGSGRGQLPA